MLFRSVLMGMRIRKSMKRFFLFFFTTIILLIIPFLFNISSTLLQAGRETDYYHFTNPQTGYELIIEEWDNYGQVGMNCYQWMGEDAFYVERLHEETYPNEGYRPFYNHNYEIVWEDDKVNIYYTYKDQEELNQVVTLMIHN